MKEKIYYLSGENYILKFILGFHYYIFAIMFFFSNQNMIKNDFICVVNS